MIARLRDAYEWSSKATPRRLRNALALWTSFQRAKWSGVPPECPSGLRSFTRPTGNLKEDLFKQVIDELAPDLWALTFYFQGEPYINPGFLAMVRHAHDKGLYTATSTNAHFLDDAAAEATVRSGLHA